MWVYQCNKVNKWLLFICAAICAKTSKKRGKNTNCLSHCGCMNRVLPHLCCAAHLHTTNLLLFACFLCSPSFQWQQLPRTGWGGEIRILKQPPFNNLWQELKGSGKSTQGLKTHSWHVSASFKELWILNAEQKHEPCSRLLNYCSH